MKIVVGISGWPDSRLTFAVLADYYEQQGWDHELLIVAHYNHGQRKESDNELKQIFKWYPHNHVYYNTDKPKRSQNETILRRFRMDFFAEVCEKEKAIYLATGHHLDDRIETSFMNLLRWTSLKWLSNMTFCDYKQWRFTLRPLISLQKWYIQELCDTNTIPYFTDKSNKNSSLTIRNALRNDIFPQMTMLSPQNKWYDSRALIYSQIERKDPDMASDHVRIIPKSPHLRRWSTFFYEIRLWSPNQSKEYTETDRIFIFQKLGIYKNVSQKTLAEWVRFSNTSADGYKFLAGVYFFIAHRKIYTIKAPENFWEEYNPLLVPITKQTEKLTFDTQKLWVKSGREGGFIRYAKPGDTFKGKRVKKRMLNQKIPLFRRNYIPVIEKKWKIIDIINLVEHYKT